LLNRHASIFRRSSRAAPTSSSGSPSGRTTARSPSWPTRQRRSRGRRCGRRPVDSKSVPMLIWDGRNRTYDGEVTTDGAWRRGGRVGGTEEDTAGLDSFTSLPDHCADWAAGHVYDDCQIIIVSSACCGRSYRRRDP